ncbi:MAG TPA: hypothetical protein VGX23_11810 [Actinocrinis sp.]|nr:hypothetical protein [Actinocrinis sp.]
MLLTSILEVADEPLELDPADPGAQACANTWWLGGEPAELGELAVGEVAAAFEQVAAALRRRIEELGYPGPATFYVWHDPQAGQLRCSTSTQYPDALPFRAAYRVVDSLDEIAGAFLEDGSPGLVPWAEPDPYAAGKDGDLDGGYEDADADGEGCELILPPFPVWVCAIGH